MTTAAPHNNKRKTGFIPLVSIRFYVVGSTAHGTKNPADLDLLGIIPNEEFEFYFGMDHDEFTRIHNETPNLPKLQRWRAHCRGAKIVLESIFPWKKVDFRFLAESMLYEPNEEVNLMELERFKNTDEISEKGHHALPTSTKGDEK